jgi:hypothetical protein
MEGYDAIDGADGEAHLGNRLLTARRRIWMISARSLGDIRRMPAGNFSARPSNRTTSTVGTGAVTVRTHRKMIAPSLWPAVSNQLATPGS